MMKKLALLIMLIGGAMAFAQRPGGPGQPPNLEEIQETLRFIRMAETKKNLSFDDDKLIAINEILDDIESRRFQLIAEERQLRSRAQKAKSDDAEADALLDEFRKLRDAMSGLERDLFQRSREVLNPTEALEFFMFYDRFTKDVQRRARMLRERGNNEQRPRRRGFRN